MATVRTCSLTADTYWLLGKQVFSFSGEAREEPDGVDSEDPGSSQKLSWGRPETHPLSEPLEPLPDMQWEDSESSVAGGRAEGSVSKTFSLIPYWDHIFKARPGKSPSDSAAHLQSLLPPGMREGPGKQPTLGFLRRCARKSQPLALVDGN